MIRTRVWIIAAAVIAVGVGGIVLSRTLDRKTPPQFAGSAVCASCHASEGAAWKSSQHAMSMQIARGNAVLGDFDSARFTNDAVTSTFFLRGDRYFVNTAGPDGAPHDYEIRWTFGVYPLQQYIVELDHGRFQALTVAWDSRPSHEGGQRWFFLTPGHGASPGDPMQCTGIQYNWNYSCADCHSTKVRKGYDARTSQFRTTFAEINVACESCHGPGSVHASRGRYASLLRRILWSSDGLEARLDERHGISWKMDSATGTARRSAPRQSDREIETCAQCHSRRVHISDGYTAGADFFDYYIPGTIEGMYYPDGQQRAEVYNYGSFLQSRMYAAGVTCSDCHNPHTAKLRRPGNKVCTQCHSASRYDTSAHHHHIIAGTTGTCTSCHMPATAYMEIDARPDHSMRIPRPDLTAAIGVPNACNGCHSGKDANWAAAQIKSWYPAPRPGFQTFAEAFAADDHDDARAPASLAAVAGDSAQPWFVRASALGRLARHGDSSALRAARASAHDERPLVRLAALQIAETFGAPERLELGVPMLRDSTLAVRKGAAWLIAPIADSLDGADRGAFESASREFVASQRYNADQPGDRVVLGYFLAQLRQYDAAEAEFRAALRLNPGMAAAESALVAIRRLRAQSGG
jgi:predicted CXXCH cytochrome family protein